MKNHVKTSAAHTSNEIADKRLSHGARTPKDVQEQELPKMTTKLIHQKQF